MTQCTVLNAVCRRFPLPIALCLVVIVCCSCRHGGQSAAVRTRALPSLAEELKQMKQAGLPVRPEDLQAPLPPEEQNAAPIYRQLVALLKSKPTAGEDKLATDFAGRKPLTAQQATQLRRAFAHRADIGRLIHTAVLRPKCVFDRKWSQGASLMFPEFANLRVATRWLNAESALQLYDGKPEAAVKTMAFGFVIARHTAQDPMLIAYLVAVAIDNITLYGLERVLYGSGERPEVARAVERAISDGWKPHSLAHGLRGEVILPLVDIERLRKSNPATYERSLIQDAKELGSGPPPGLSADDRAHWDRFIDRSETAILLLIHRLIVIADQPYFEADREFRSIVGEVENHKEDAAYLNARIIAPVYTESVRARARAEARSTTTRTAASLLIWKSQHGSFPDKLDSAMPKAPIDPFSGAPLKYKREGKGFVVYSVGASGKFDGGNPATKPDGKESLTRYPGSLYLK